jgi:hypothetical protein
MEHAAEFRRCLVDLDVAAAMRLWAHVNPHLPQPTSAGQMTIVLHHARTQANSVPLKLRAWSHRWLLDHDLPSGLPDALKPKAERLYPKIIEAVGISVNVSSPEMKPVAEEVQRAMSDAVLESFADGITDPVLVSAAMKRGREKAIASLIGRNRTTIPS